MLYVRMCAYINVIFVHNKSFRDHVHASLNSHIGARQRVFCTGCIRTTVELIDRWLPGSHSAAQGLINRACALELDHVKKMKNSSLWQYHHQHGTRVRTRVRPRVFTVNCLYLLVHVL